MMLIKSEIDVEAEDQDKAVCLKEGGLKGDIEFIDVWFRYPTRPDQWIFKGLNLKIKQNERFAIVGESG